MHPAALPVYPNERTFSEAAGSNLPQAPSGKRQGIGAVRLLIGVEDAIKELLDDGLPRVYDPELYNQKSSPMFEHFYENYPQRDANVYRAAL
jgi:hypothetical protein